MNRRCFKRLRIVFMPEKQCEQDGNNQGVRRKGEPYSSPVKRAICAGKEGIDQDPADAAAEKSPESVGHHHEQSLGAGPDTRFTLAFYVQRAGYVKEIESHSVDDAGSNDHPETVGRVPVSEQTKAKHPGDHAEKHYFFDSEPSQEEGNSKNKQGFGDLGNRHDDGRVFYCDQVLVFRYIFEVVQKGIPVSIGQLKGSAQQHGKDEEDGHFIAFEKAESMKA